DGQQIGDVLVGPPRPGAVEAEHGVADGDAVLLGDVGEHAVVHQPRRQDAPVVAELREHQLRHLAHERRIRRAAATNAHHRHRFAPTLLHGRSALPWPLWVPSLATWMRMTVMLSSPPRSLASS